LFKRSMSEPEKELFARICMPAYSLPEDVKGRLLYAMNKKKTPDNLLREAFPEDYDRIMSTVILEKSRFSIKPRPDLIVKYFLEYHNKEQPCKVEAGKVVGFRAERKGKENSLTARVVLDSGKTVYAVTRIAPGMTTRINLNDRVLVHNKVVCHVLE